MDVLGVHLHGVLDQLVVEQPRAVDHAVGSREENVLQQVQRVYVAHLHLVLVGVVLVEIRGAGDREKARRADRQRVS